MNNKNTQLIHGGLPALSLFAGLLLLILLALQPLNATPVLAHQPPAVGQLAEKDADILAINDDIKAILDKEIRPIRLRAERAVQLHDLMFARHRWNIMYSSQRTLTAQQTFDYKQGNCISLASLYVAAARYVGLDAKFQQVDIYGNWELRDDYYVVPGHVNVIVPLPRKTVNIEFLQTFYDSDFGLKNKSIISDARAFSQFKNNIAMEYYDLGNLPLALEYLAVAVAHDPTMDFIWSNYGVASKAYGKLRQAEAYYRKSLRINRRNLSALSNLYVLLEETGRDEEAQRISERVKAYRLKNPYYLAKLAETDLNNGDYTDALTLIRKALRKDKDEAKFYHLQARILLALARPEQALKSLEKARDKSKSTDEIRRYEHKVSRMMSKI